MARTIKVDYLARVEGEGALTIRFKGDQPKSVELRIFEPPRFFEAFLRGRAQHETPDITARICGICPVAYQMSACHAVENAHGVQVSPDVRALRRLLYCGEWIESHALHMFLLHAPDFLGFQDGVAMAAEHREWVLRGLSIKKTGNALVAAVGGREVHPVNVRVGGFYRAPDADKLRGLLPDLVRAQQAMRESLDWMQRFDFPEFERDYEFVALRHPTEYPFCEGRLVSNRGLDIDVSEYPEHFEERQLPHSTALHSVLKARGHYFCGPLARINLNFELLRPVAREAARAIGLEPPCRNPFRSLLVRGVETLHALSEAQWLIEQYAPPEPAHVEVPARAGTGHGCTEAPRGILYHRYRMDTDGNVADATIIPPTSQNQGTIEADLFELARELAKLPHAEATWRAEQAVRNYDPCISCSTHFLKLKIEHDTSTPREPSEC